MAKTNKIVIRVTPGRRTQSISWQGSGDFGTLNLSQEFGTIPSMQVTSEATVKAYVTAILAAVSAALV